MLNELQNLVPSKKEQKLQVFVNQLINDLYNNKKIEVDSEKLLELLSYLTSDENISTQMKSCVEVQNRRITDILHKKEVDKLKNEIKYMEKNYIPSHKVKNKIEENNKLIEKCKDELENYGEIYLYEHDNKILQELLEDK